MIWITITFEVNESSGDWGIQNRAFVVIVIFYLFIKIRFVQISSIYDELLSIMLMIWKVFYIYVFIEKKNTFK